MSKRKNGILFAITLILIIAVGIASIFIMGKDDTPKENNSSDTVISEVSSSVTVEDIEDNSSKTVETESNENFITPDETEADKLLQNNSTDSSGEKEESKVEKTELTAEEPKPIIENSESSETVDETQTFEEGQKELENTASDYLKEHNIDPTTAGETGELCPNCNKKIWNPD